jgi:hypothetical protein
MTANPDPDQLSVDDARIWVQQQRDDMNALLERRYAEAEAIVADYASEKAAWPEVDKRMTEHMRRWSYMDLSPEAAELRRNPKPSGRER